MIFLFFYLFACVAATALLANDTNETQVITVNKTTLIANDSILPDNVDANTIVEMNSSTLQILPNPIFIAIPDTNVSTESAITSKPYTLSLLSYNERSIMFLANVVRLSYSAYVTMFSGASPSYSPTKGCCFANSGSLVPLYWSSVLQTSMVAHVKDMVQTNKFQHETCSLQLCSQYGSCSFASRMAYFYKKALLCGENVGVNFQTPVSIMNAYLNSPGHCANLKYPSFREMSSSQIGNYWGNDFGGGPADYTTPLLVGNHFANFDGSMSFYVVYSDLTNKFTPSNQIYVCINFSDCHLMSIPTAFNGVASYSTLYAFTMDAASISLKTQSLSTCASYTFYALKSDKSWARLPEIGSFQTTQYKLCNKAYDN